MVSPPELKVVDNLTLIRGDFVHGEFNLAQIERTWQEERLTASLN